MNQTNLNDQTKSVVIDTTTEEKRTDVTETVSIDNTENIEDIETNITKLNIIPVSIEKRKKEEE